MERGLFRKVHVLEILEKSEILELEIPKNAMISKRMVGITVAVWVLTQITVRVKIITGSLVTLDNLFPQNYCYRCRLEIRSNSFNYHDRYRLGVRSHTFMSIDSQLPS